MERFRLNMSIRSLTATAFIPIALSLLTTQCDKPTGPDTGNLEVLVIDWEFNPIADAVVELEQPELMETTNEDGLAFFFDLPVGEYDLSVDVPDCARYRTPVTIESDQTLEHTATIGWLPGTFSIYARLKNIGVPDLHVVVTHQGNTLEEFSGDTDEEGKLTTAPIPVGQYTITADSTLIFATPCVEAEILSNKSTYVELWPTTFASQFSGFLDFHTGQKHTIYIYQVNPDNRIILLPKPVFYSDYYKIATSVMGRLGAAVFGNGSDLEFNAVLSRVYQGSEHYINVKVPPLLGWLNSASPTGEPNIVTTDLPMELNFTFPSSGIVYNEWQIYRWRQDESENWQYELIWYEWSYSSNFDTEWDGWSNNLHTQTGPQEGLYSWAVIAVFRSQIVKYSNDYFFHLVEPTRSGEYLRRDMRLSPADLHALRSTAFRSLPERHSDLLSRFPIQPE